MKYSGAFIWALSAVSMFLAFASVVNSQSTDQAFPTAVTENQLTGRIKARDIGDARLTTYYYTFNAHQGDLFVNLVTKNLNGSVYLFAEEGLRPLAQILVYADLSASETGRVIYLRKPEKLLLRVEGRTPNDDPAEFQLKFAGSFEAVAPTEEPAAPKVSDATALENSSGVRVNSVGTIVAVVPKPKPTPKPPVVSEPEKASEKTETAASEPAETKSAETKAETEKPEEAKAEPSKPSDEVKTTEEKPVQPATETAKRPPRRTRTASQPPANDAATTAAALPKTESTATKADETANANPVGAKTAKTSAPKRTKPTVVVTDNTVQPKPDPLASIDLVIVFKDGTRIERPMNEVLRFSVDKGVLTVISKDGTSAKYSIFDVSSVTIQ